MTERYTHIFKDSESRVIRQLRDYTMVPFHAQELIDTLLTPLVDTDTYEGMKLYLMHIMRAKTVNELTEGIHEQLRVGKVGKLFPSEELDFSEVLGVEITNGFQLDDSDIADAITLGVKEGMNDYIGLIEMVPDSASILWKRSIAERIFPHAEKREGELVVFHPTHVYGMEVKAHYSENEQFPQRSIVNFPYKKS